MIIVELKMTQPFEPDEEPVDLFSSIGQMMQKPSFYSRTIVQSVKVEP